MSVSVGIAASSMAGEETFEQKVEKAEAIIKQRKRNIEEQQQVLDELQNSLNSFQKQILTPPQTDKKIHVIFHALKTRHSWPTDPEYRSYQDYDVTLDMSDASQEEKLHSLFEKWLKDGWFVLRSEFSSSESTNNTVVSIRFARP
jgi:DNA-binding protein H-NS